MKSTTKVFQVLETLCLNGAAGLSELSDVLGINKSSLHRFLAVLIRMGYVEKKDGHRYEPTLKVYRLGSDVKGRLSLAGIARSHMQQLNQSLEETVNLAVFTDNSVVVIERIESSKTLRTNLVIGGRLPAHCTAFGKIFLSEMTSEELARYVSGAPLERFTKNTLTSVPALEKELAGIRKNGYALDNQELAEGVRCIATAIRDESGRVVAAISISTPTSRVSREQLLSFRPQVIAATSEISKALGFRE
jgi:DNA-binding IclR family transcriptional regulator